MAFVISIVRDDGNPMVGLGSHITKGLVEPLLHWLQPLRMFADRLLTDLQHIFCSAKPCLS